jgi:hypothetical protein
MALSKENIFLGLYSMMNLQHMEELRIFSFSVRKEVLRGSKNKYRFLYRKYD